MKIDIDSILYIVITAVILILSGLNSRRKKSAQMAAQAEKARKQDGEAEDEEYYESDAIEEEPEASPFGIFKNLESAAAKMSGQTSNPFDKLEQLINPQDPYLSPKINEIESMEGKTMEETVDEEEQILEEIKRRNESGYTDDEAVANTEPEPMEKSTSTIDKESQVLPELFGNIDEIKKAVIYSEILNRKY